MTNILKSTPGLIISFILMVVIGFGFSFFTIPVGGAFLDTVFSPAEARDIIAGMTQDERNAHFWMTVLLDTAYPLAYGAFLAGMALRFFGRAGGWLSLPAFLTIIVDLAENTLQAMALKGTDMLGAKAVLTPLKFGLFLTAAMIALLALIWGIIQAVKRKRQTASRS